MGDGRNRWEVEMLDGRKELGEKEVDRVGGMWVE